MPQDRYRPQYTGDDRRDYGRYYSRSPRGRSWSRSRSRSRTRSPLRNSPNSGPASQWDGYQFTFGDTNAPRQAVPNFQGDGSINTSHLRPQTQRRPHNRPLMALKRTKTPPRLAGMKSSGFEIGDLYDEQDVSMEIGPGETSEGTPKKRKLTENTSMVVKSATVTTPGLDTIDESQVGPSTGSTLPGDIKANAHKLIQEMRVTAHLKVAEAVVIQNDASSKENAPIFGNHDFVPFELSPPSRSAAASTLKADNSEMGSDHSSRPGPGFSGAMTADDNRFSHRDHHHKMSPNLPETARPTIVMPAKVPIAPNASKRKLVDLDDGNQMLVDSPSQSRQTGPLPIRMPPIPMGMLRKEYVSTKGLQSPWKTYEAPQEDTLEALKVMQLALPSLQLHEEVVKAVGYLSPTNSEIAVRKHLLRRISDQCRLSFPGCEVKSFGSFAIQLYLPTSDMDLVLISDRFSRYGQQQFTKNAAVRYIRQMQRDFINVKLTQYNMCTMIPNARVPIFKFTDLFSRIQVDISFDNSSGPKAVQTYNQWKSEVPMIPYLMIILKQFLSMREMNDVAYGGLGSFGLLCMVRSFFAMCPSARNTSGYSGRGRIGEMLLEFLDLYGNRFNYDEVGIRFQPHDYFSKKRDRQQHKQSMLWIKDPNDPTNNVTKGTRRMPEIKLAFKHAHANITARLSQLADGQKNISLLEGVIGGDYDHIERFRTQLKDVCRMIHPEDAIDDSRTTSGAGTGFEVDDDSSKSTRIISTTRGHDWGRKRSPTRSIAESRNDNRSRERLPQRSMPGSWDSNRYRERSPPRHNASRRDDNRRRDDRGVFRPSQNYSSGSISRDRSRERPSGHGNARQRLPAAFKGPPPKETRTPQANAGGAKAKSVSSSILATLDDDAGRRRAEAIAKLSTLTMAPVPAHQSSRNFRQDFQSRSRLDPKVGTSQSKPIVIESSD